MVSVFVRITYNWLREDIPCLFWNDTKLQYKHMNILGVLLYIIHDIVTRNKLDNISQRTCFMVYVATTGFILYCKPNQTYNLRLTINIQGFFRILQEIRVHENPKNHRKRKKI